MDSLITWVLDSGGRGGGGCLWLILGEEGGSGRGERGEFVRMGCLVVLFCLVWLEKARVCVCV